MGANRGLGEALKSCTRKEHESATNSIAKRGQGAMPLAESRGGASGGVWGNAPTVPRATNSKDEVNKGAGSEASLPVTLRFLRSAPKLLYLPLAYCRADGRDRPVSREVFSCCWSFLLQGDAPAGATRGQWKQTKSAVAPLTPSQCAPMFIVFFVAGRNERYTKL